MMTLATFTGAGWDFDDIWFIIEDESYPPLRWQDITPPVADAGPDQFVDEGARVEFNGSGSHDNAGIVNWTFHHEPAKARVHDTGRGP